MMAKRSLYWTGGWNLGTCQFRVDILDITD